VLLMIAVAGFIKNTDPLISMVGIPPAVGIQEPRLGRLLSYPSGRSRVFAGLLAAFGYPAGTTEWLISPKKLPSYVAGCRARQGGIGHLFTRFHLQAWINKNAPKLQSLGNDPGQAGPYRRRGRGVAAGHALATILALIVLFLLECPKIWRAALQRLPQDRAAYYSGVAREITVGDWLRLWQPADLADRRRGHVRHAFAPRGFPSRCYGDCGSPGPTSSPWWEGALAGIPTVAFALFAPLAHRRHRHRGRVHRLSADREPRAEPRHHEPHDQGQSAARLAVAY